MLGDSQQEARASPTEDYHLRTRGGREEASLQAARLGCPRKEEGPHLRLQKGDFTGHHDMLPVRPTP